MKPAAVNLNFYSIYQDFKADKEPDQRNKYAHHCDSQLWFLTNTNTDVSSQCHTQYPYGDHTHKTACTLERMWQQALVTNLESPARYPQSEIRRLQK